MPAERTGTTDTPSLTKAGNRQGGLFVVAPLIHRGVSYGCAKGSGEWGSVSCRTLLESKAAVVLVHCKSLRAFHARLYALRFVGSSARMTTGKHFLVG